MRVSVVGTGYVGLVSGVCLAEKGHDVTCVDIDNEKIKQINRGETPIYEKGLQRLLRRNLGQRFRATTDLRAAILDSEVTLIAVGTPFDGNTIDLSHVKNASSQTGKVLRDKTDYHVVVIKSTVIPGTTDGVVTALLEKESGKQVLKDFGVGMNPEFLREGDAVHDFLYPDRLVLGGSDRRTCDVLKKLYLPFPDVDIVITNTRTAETIKYTTNALLATMISFSNDIGNLCARIGNVDVVEVMKGVHLDKRISPILQDGRRVKPGFTSYIEAGCGFGGSCFPKDVKALVAYGQNAGNPLRVLEAVIDVNRDQPLKMLALLRRRFPILSGLRVTILGLAFKPGTNDMRESPAIPIVNELIAQEATVTAYDPVARNEAEAVFGRERLRYSESLADALTNAQAVLLLTRWPAFEAIPELLSAMTDPPLLIDGRRMLDPRKIPRYLGIGTGDSLPGNPGVTALD